MTLNQGRFLLMFCSEIYRCVFEDIGLIGSKIMDDTAIVAKLDQTLRPFIYNKYNGPYILYIH